MSRIVKILVLILGIFYSLTYTDHDEAKSIMDVFRNSVEAWNRGDINGFLKSYADLETVRLISGGQTTIGKEAVVNAFKSRFLSPELMGVLTLKNLQIEILTASDALFWGEFNLERDHIVSSGIFTGHMKKFPDRWAIVSDHTSDLE